MVASSPSLPLSTLFLLHPDFAFICHILLAVPPGCGCGDERRGCGDNGEDEEGGGSGEGRFEVVGGVRRESCGGEGFEGSGNAQWWWWRC